MSRRITFHLCFALICNLVYTQTGTPDQPNTRFIGIKPQYGFIIPHSQSIKDISHSNPFGLEVDYGWHLNSLADWKRCFCYSKGGFSLLHMNYDNPEVLGSSTSLTAFAEPYFNYRSDWMTSLRMGVGPTYTSKYYDIEENPQNLFFSTPFSFFINLDLNLYYRMTPQWFIHGYFKYNHISNGGVNEPNKGMNFPSYGIGMEYAFEDLRFRERKRQSLDSTTNYFSSISAFGTVKNVSTGAGFSERTPAYIYGFLGKFGRRTSVLNAISGGLEYISDGSVKKKNSIEDRDLDHRLAGFLIGNDILFGRFMFSQHWGTYLYAPAVKKRFYQRYTLHVNLFHNMLLGVTLKAHAQVADNFNLLIGYTF